MKLHNRKTNREIEVDIIEVEAEEYAQIEKSKRFEFEWILEQQYHVFKLISLEDEKILGLMSLINIPEELRIHINLIENSNENKGKQKEIDKIAGCLLAYAVQLAFGKGYQGFTSLIPKTRLIPLYVNKYGFSQYGRQLAIEGNAAIQLIKKYL